MQINDLIDLFASRINQASEAAARAKGKDYELATHSNSGE